MPSSSKNEMSPFGFASLQDRKMSPAGHGLKQRFVSETLSVAPTSTRKPAGASRRTVLWRGASEPSSKNQTPRSEACGASSRSAFQRGSSFEPLEEEEWHEPDSLGGWPAGSCHTPLSRGRARDDSCDFPRGDSNARPSPFRGERSGCRPEASGKTPK